MSRKQAQLLDQLVGSKALSPSGRSFLIAALDPFHDEEIRIDGFPDITSSRSVVQCLQYVKTITKPTGLPAGDWDCHMFNVPVSYNDGLPGGLLQPQVLVKSAGIYGVPGNAPEITTGFAAVATASGGTWTDPASVLVSQDLSMPRTYSDGRHRLFGFGYEVVNTTAELYKQGSVTTYKRPGKNVPICAFECISGASTLPQTNSRSKLYAFGSTGVSTAAQAAAYPNSRTWAAKEGAYVIATLNDVDCPVTEALPAGVHLAVENKYVNNSDNTPGMFGYGNLPTDETNMCAYPFDISGCVFAGLSESTSLTVTVRYLVERFPENSNPDLVVIARPSPSYDPLALELYARCLESLPTAVMVRDNPLGEWFSKILQTVGKVAPIVGSFIPGLGPVIGNAVGTVATAVGDHLAKAKGNPQPPQSAVVPAAQAAALPPPTIRIPVARPSTLRGSDLRRRPQPASRARLTVAQRRLLGRRR